MAPARSLRRRKSQATADDVAGELESQIEGGEAEVEGKTSVPPPKRMKTTKKDESEPDGRFIGKPVPAAEARLRWPERYEQKSEKNVKCDVDDDPVIYARNHYLEAEIEDRVYCLYDNVYVKAEEGKPNYIGRIVEFFESTDSETYFTSQWFYRVEDTVIGEADSHDPRRIFISSIQNVNALDSIVSKLTITQVDLAEKKKIIPPCDFYYDMSYSPEYSTFLNLPTETLRGGSETSSLISTEDVVDSAISSDDEHSSDSKFQKSPKCLDLYSGCGGMSTGLCLGANLAEVKLVTKWAVDLNEYACDSLRLNHPEALVRNETVDDFLALLKEWKLLCERHSLLGTRKLRQKSSNSIMEDEEVEEHTVSPTEFEVAKIVDISYGEFPDGKKRGLKFKVRWKGYGPKEDTWEPIDGLSKCQERIEDFVRKGYKSGILPLPGDVDVICGGPPCQGISGFNRFRNYKAPLQDPKNKQMLVFMEVVEYLKPKYVLMENVVDILKFAGGHLARYALSCLIRLNYQARLGMMVAGCYGLPQFRMRVFLWGAVPTEKLPQYPLPTHNVVVRGNAPAEFKQCLVAFDETQTLQLAKALVLNDAISDLPPVENDERRDEMPYGGPPKTDFQRHIRLLKNCSKKQTSKSLPLLFDHRPLELNNDDYQRVCQIPKRKGANFRDLPGVKVGQDNVVEWDPTIERVYLSSGKPLVPDYAMSFLNGKSQKPFGRLWWDDTVPTVVTRAEPHNQIILHPIQDRVLTIRENARLQGFPDHYKLVGPVKERYIQVGNAVAVPVARALGYALGLAFEQKIDNKPVMTLPTNFPFVEKGSLSTIEVDDIGVID